MTKENYLLKALEEQDFESVIELGNLVHGDGYLSYDALAVMLQKSVLNGLNASFVLYDGKKLIGFRISYAPKSWDIDKWCTPSEWPIEKSTAAYFKCNTIDPSYQGKGLGGRLLNASVSVLKKMGAKGGISHIWMQSPGNASYKYFTKAGGILIKQHKNRWANDPSLPDYNCVICGTNCHCTASEMMLVF